jgi:hypothetical protein
MFTATSYVKSRKSRRLTKRERARAFLRDSKGFVTFDEHGGVTTSSAIFSAPIPRPIRWAEAPEDLKVKTLGRAISARRPTAPYAFTLNVDQKIHRHASNPVAQMHERIKRRLKQALGRDVEYVVVAHCRVTGKPDELHYHGILDIDEQELAAVIKALKLAGGKWRGGSDTGRQVLSKRCFGNIDTWTGYSIQEAARVRRFIRAHWERVGFSQKRPPQVYAETRKLAAEARELHEQFREATKPTPTPRRASDDYHLTDEELRWLEEKLRAEEDRVVV